MRFLLVLTFAAVALGGTIYPNKGIGRPFTDNIDAYDVDLLENDSEIEYGINNEDSTVKVAPQFVISWQVRRIVRKLRKQMSCGWEQFGIPPLAPLKMREAKFNIAKGIFETFNTLFRFRVDGLDEFKIIKLKLNMITNKIKFDLLFKNVQASASKYETNTILNGMRQLGLSVQYKGDGSLEFGLKNLRLAGVIKYKLPILWGSAKITSMKTNVTVQEINSNIVGFMGESSINRMINRQLEMLAEKGINDNNQQISKLIEDNLVSRVNKLLKGKDFWTLVDKILSKGGDGDGDDDDDGDGENENELIETNCLKPADPWA